MSEELSVAEHAERLGLPDPKTMFDPQACEPTGLKKEFQRTDNEPPLLPGDVFIYFGDWVSCVETVGSNFSVVYDINRDRFLVAGLIGTDTRCVGTPKKIEGIDIDGLRGRYRASQHVIVAHETSGLLDNAHYELKPSDLSKINIRLMAAGGSMEGRRIPIETRKIRMGTFDDIRIEDNGNVVEHIIIPKVEDQPTIVVGDWHQSIVSEIPILRGLGLLPKHLPVQVDWVDEHTDEYFEDFSFLGGKTQMTESERKDRTSLLKPPKTISEALQKTRRIHCGQAALALSGKVTHITHPVIFGDQQPAQWEDIFNTTNPFIRKSNKPHILSLDCDFFDYWARSSLGSSQEAENFDALARFLIEEKRLNFRAYDAVMIYTSPKYCKPEVAREVVNFVKGNV